jgi:hypothetical protein
MRLVNVRYRTAGEFNQVVNRPIRWEEKMDKPFSRSGASNHDAFIEAMWETLIALGTAVAICIGIISLAAHLNETQQVRQAASSVPEMTGPGDAGTAPRTPTSVN